MPADLLQACRSYLETSYRNRLGVSFSGSLAALGKSTQPVWRFVSSEDLTHEVRADARDAAGLLLDPEIGVLLYLLPFDADASIHSQIVRALALRSKLTTEHNYTGRPTDDSDTRGSWRLVAHWLVYGDGQDKWMQEVMDVRRDTGFSEEISLDAIFLRPGKIEPQLAAHGFPRLLLTAREVFRNQKLEEVARWLSANQLVAEALEAFEEHFHQAEQREFAGEVTRAMRDFLSRLSTPSTLGRPPETPYAFRKLRVQNFRNLRDLSLDLGGDSASARIVYGPNGTGKSALTEAISVALFHSSLRYKTFVDRDHEKDIAGTNRARAYLDEYLSLIDPRGARAGPPKIALDSDEFHELHLIDPEKADEADLAMSGTILTQDTSLDFARMSSAKLATRVLRGYSELANRVEEFTESRVAQAGTARQDFLRRFGLPASITKLDTAYDRIVRHEIDRTLPPFPHNVVTWIEAVGKSQANVTSDLPDRWRSWSNDESRNGLAREISRAANDASRGSRLVLDWLSQYNDLVNRTGEFLESVEVRVGPIRDELEQMASHVTAWGEWLERQTHDVRREPSSQIAALVVKVCELQTKQQQVLERGRDARAHLGHLERVEAFVRETWSKAHPDECPTCGVNHAEQGGILRVVETLRTGASRERDRLLQEFEELKLAIERAQGELVGLGHSECPVTVSDQARASAALRWLLPLSQDFAAWIASRVRREELLRVLATLRQMPSPLMTVNAEAESQRFVSAVLQHLREADRTFDAPSNWKAVQAKLTELLAEIVNKHLPDTLARLWCELAMNLTPAPWLLPGRPSIGVVGRRGEQRATILVKDRLARYILNQSEVHVLGLAWFFTRYLTRGRFFHASVIMDDPAQELDQTAFRDLCRLWETLMRFHRVYNRPIKLVLMLNQESRAIEAARATGGILTVFGWSPSQDRALSAIDVVGDGFYPPQPARLFEAAVS